MDILQKISDDDHEIYFLKTRDNSVFFELPQCLDYINFKVVVTTTIRKNLGHNVVRNSALASLYSLLDYKLVFDFFCVGMHDKIIASYRHVKKQTEVAVLTKDHHIAPISENISTSDFYEPGVVKVIVGIEIRNVCDKSERCIVEKMSDDMSVVISIKKEKK